MKKESQKSSYSLDHSPVCTVTGLLTHVLLPPQCCNVLFLSAPQHLEKSFYRMLSNHNSSTGFFFLLVFSCATLMAVFPNFLFLLFHFAVSSSSNKFQDTLLLLGLIKLKTLLRVNEKFMKFAREQRMTNGFTLR